MNDIDLYIDNKKELQAIIEQIGIEYPEGHRIRKMVDKIIIKYREYIRDITFRSCMRELDLDMNVPLEDWSIPFTLSHERKCLNSHYNYLLYRLTKFYKMAKTPASIKSLIELLFKTGLAAAQEQFRQTNEFHSKLEVERDPMTGKVRKKLSDDGFTEFGALINIKKSKIKEE